MSDKPLTRADLARLREVVGRMTPGPWIFTGAPTPEDIVGIAALRNAALALIGQVDGAMGVVRAAKEALVDVLGSSDTQAVLTVEWAEDLRRIRDRASALLAAYDRHDEGGEGRHG